MIDNKTIAVVIPAYNEQRQIKLVLSSIPKYVDKIIVINDGSKDRTAKYVIDEIDKHKVKTKTSFKSSQENKFGLYDESLKLLLKKRNKENKYYPPSKIFNNNPENDRLILINHKKNYGVGAAILTGYKYCRDQNIFCTAVMAGDGQMDPSELKSICEPIISEDIDYVKGNRLSHKAALLVIPKIRFIGNSILSMLTKIASGYWNVSDTQCGYTSISLRALNSIKIYDIYRIYGMPNDLLVKLNIISAKLKEVDIKPVYGIGEKSKMKIMRMVPRVSRLLLLSFFKRLWVKYFFKDLHPLFLFYHFSLFLFLLNIPLFIHIFYEVIIKWGTVSVGMYLAFVLIFISSFQSLFFAMWMDMQDNNRLYKE
jgi:glycosyltransferase involved in cell wall biosynthesis